MSQITYGDFIIIEIALLHYISGLDLSTQSGQYLTEILGKIEYNLAQIKQETIKNTPIDPKTIHPTEIKSQ